MGEEDGLVDDDFLAEAALLGAGDLDLADGVLAGLLPRGAGDLLRPERLALLFGGIPPEIRRGTWSEGLFDMLNSKLASGLKTFRDLVWPPSCQTRHVGCVQGFRGPELGREEYHEQNRGAPQ